MKPWVVDASPLLFLAKIQRLDLLESSWSEILVPRAVLDEVLAVPDPAGEMIQQATGSWLEVAELEAKLSTEILLADLGPGEAHVLQLARERDARRVVLDDLDARRYARRLGLEPIGTLGLLLAAHLRGEIPSLEAEIARLRQMGFYASDALIVAVLRAAGEHSEG